MSISIDQTINKDKSNLKVQIIQYKSSRDRKIKPIKVEDFLSTRFGLLAPTPRSVSTPRNSTITNLLLGEDQTSTSVSFSHTLTSIEILSILTQEYSLAILRDKPLLMFERKDLVTNTNVQ
ncbi:hypothetical protein LguiB_028334 [Lonicera macranthoides]